MSEGEQAGTDRDTRCWRCGAEVPASVPRRPMPPRPPHVDPARYPAEQPPACADCLPGWDLDDARSGSDGHERYGRLVSVATPGAELRVGEGARAVVLGLDRWEGCTQLRVAETGPEPRPPSPWSWDAHDDTGRRYWGFYSGWSGGEGDWRLAELDLVPAIDPDATRLTLVLTNRVAGERAEVTVDLDDARPPRPLAGRAAGPGEPAGGTGEAAPGSCRWCGAPAEAVAGGRAGEQPRPGFCDDCRPVFHRLLGHNGNERPPAGPLVPLAVVVGDLSPAVDGRLTVLAIEHWGDHSVLRTVLVGPGMGCETTALTTGRWRLTTASGRVHDGAWAGGHGTGGRAWADVIVDPPLATDDLAGLVVEVVVAGRPVVATRLG
jgi:hypothetical protein